MKRHASLSVVGLVILFGVGMGYQGASQGAEGSEDIPQGDVLRRLEFDLVLSKGSVVLYEPVVLRMRLSNPTNVSVVVEPGLLALGADVKLGVVDASGGRHEFHAGPAVGPLGSRVELGPGESIEAGLLMLENEWEKRLAFRSPGRYGLAGEVRVGRGTQFTTITAEEVKVDVGEPSHVDRAFVDRLGGPESLVEILQRTSTAYCRKSEDVQCVDALWRAPVEFPTSAYAPFLQYDLARGLSSGGSKAVAGERPATDEFESFLKQWPTHPLRPWVLNYLTLGYAQWGPKEKARQYLEVFRSEFPGMRESISAIQQQIDSQED